MKNDDKISVEQAKLMIQGNSKEIERFNKTIVEINENIIMKNIDEITENVMQVIDRHIADKSETLSAVILSEIYYEIGSRIDGMTDSAKEIYI